MTRQDYCRTPHQNGQSLERTEAVPRGTHRMRLHLLRPSDLDAATIARWRQLQHSNPALASPYFTPDFTLAVADVRPDVQVTVLEEHGDVVGFFPFQQRWGAGEPVGGRLSDHHGVVAAPGTRWDWVQLLRASRLGYWQFDHLTGVQRPLVPAKPSVSHAIDLSRGYDGYRQAKRDAGSETIAKLERRARKLERDVGPLRFVANSADDHVLQHVIDRKREQCRRTGALEYFAWPWTRALVYRIRQADAPEFAGRLSALYVGDALVAAHFGMRSRQVWHGWFTVYDPAWSTWSPGSLLLLNMAQAAAAEGNTLMDLGKGEEPFKKMFSDCTLPLLEGVVTRPSLATGARSLRKSLGRWLHTSPIAQPLRPLVQSFKRSAGLLGALMVPLTSGFALECCP
jgi:CelD/BcsL family acetyltransferase involved in cellulose biosynthesis